MCQEKQSVLFAIFDYEHIVVESFDKIAFSEFRVVKVFEILVVLLDYHGIGRVEDMAYVSQPQFVGLHTEREGGFIQSVFGDFVAVHKSCPNFHM